MKRLFVVLALIGVGLSLNAAPVSVDEAQVLAKKYMQNENLTLVYSMPSFYVFNAGDKGFVIFSSDDSYSPIIGYSNENAFDPDNMAPALEDYLNGINDYRMQRGVANADFDVARDWESLREYGHMVSRFDGKGADYLVTTKWNQNYPYNYCCPVAETGPGGHVYAGCVATAAAQVMRYWSYPLHGTGSHTYIPEDNPQYGPLTANFGTTTYDWDNMPNQISASSPVAELEAVGTLIYHCGVAVDMNYRPTGSGAQTTLLCTVMPQYFSYTNNMVNYYRDSYTKDAYLNMIFKAIDKGWPMVHRGGGHAYVLDGYDADGLVHFNWGWSGSNDGFYDIDGHNYTDGQSVIYNYVPSSIYSSTPNYPTNVVATAGANNDLSVTVSWKNPTKTLTNQNLSSISSIVVMRNNVVVYTEDNVTPGAEMSFVDNNVPCFDSYTYRIYAMVNGQIGESAYSSPVNIGPTCQWSFVVSSQNIQGWRNAHIDIYNAAGTLFKTVTTNSSTVSAVNVAMPLGSVQMVWVPSGETSSFNITLNVKDSQNNSVFNFNGNIMDMQEGVFYSGANGCGNTAPTESPSDLYANKDGDNIVLSWTGVSSKDGYGYNVYRDGMLVKLSNTNEWVDENPSLGGHCYQVCYLGLGGQSEFSNEACGAAGEGCDTGSDLWYEVQANMKPLITWEHPEAGNPSGYFIYRKIGDDGDYTQAKIVAGNKKEFKETKTLEDGTWYYYKVIPYYQTNECMSSPIKALHGNEYFVKYYYSLDAVGENTTQEVSVYPNPTNGNLKIEGTMLSNVIVYNLVGQKVYEENISGDEYVIDMKRFGSGIYMIRIQSANGLTTKKITVIE